MKSAARQRRLIRIADLVDMQVQMLRYLTQIRTKMARYVPRRSGASKTAVSSVIDYFLTLQGHLELH